MPSPYAQADARVRLEWGPTGAAELAAEATYAVVVDVLSFTTTLSVAMDLGAEVFPYRWRDDSAREYADARGAALAVGRREALEVPGLVSLSPAGLRAAQGLERLVLPSPNGSAISARLAGGGARVVGASLRNRSAVAAWLTARLAEDPAASVAFVAAGERWRSDGSLRPALEDLLGVGAVLSAMDGDRLSPEAALARSAFEGTDVRATVRACSSGRELLEKGFGDDVEVSLEVDASPWVPVLSEESFRRG